MEFLCENSYRFLAVKHFRKHSPSKMFDRVLNKMTGFWNYSVRSFENICEFFYKMGHMADVTPKAVSKILSSFSLLAETQSYKLCSRYCSASKVLSRVYFPTIKAYFLFCWLLIKWKNPTKMILTDDNVSNDKDSALYLICRLLRSHTRLKWIL